MEIINSKVMIPGEVVAVLTDVRTGKKRVYKTKNIISDAGDIYYAQRMAAETPTNAFGIMELGTAGGAPAKGDDRSAVTAFVANSQKAFDGGYPQTNDPDADNTGAGADVCSYLTSYTTGEANAADISDIIITNVTPGATEPVLTHAKFAATFTKTATDSLKVFVNHTANGV